MEFTEKRRLKRRHLIYYLRVFEQATNRLLGHLVDITSEGLMLISEDPMDVYQTYKMRMILPTEILSKEELEFEARCMWCKKDINPDFYAMGFQILDINQDDLMIITPLIRRYGFND